MENYYKRFEFRTFATTIVVLGYMYSLISTKYYDILWTMCTFLIYTGLQWGLFPFPCEQKPSISSRDADGNHDTIMLKFSSMVLCMNEYFQKIPIPPLWKGFFSKTPPTLLKF